MNNGLRHPAQNNTRLPIERIASSSLQQMRRKRIRGEIIATEPLAGLDQPTMRLLAAHTERIWQTQVNSTFESFFYGDSMVEAHTLDVPSRIPTREPPQLAVIHAMPVVLQTSLAVQSPTCVSILNVEARGTTNTRQPQKCVPAPDTARSDTLSLPGIRNSANWTPPHRERDAVLCAVCWSS